MAAEATALRHKNPACRILYVKLSDYYHPEDESGIPWNDETIGIRWPIPKDMTLLTSERDSRHPAFGEGSALKPKKNRKTMEATVHANVMDESSRGRI